MASSSSSSRQRPDLDIPANVHGRPGSSVAITH
jgi:hypothetical protein